MTAEFYIIPESFANNTQTSDIDIENKTKALANDFVEIKKQNATNKILVHPDIYNVLFIKNITIADLLFNDQTANQNLDRDTRTLLKKIILESETTNHTIQEVKEVLLPEHNEDLCHGLIGFNEVPNIDSKFQIVYNINGWLDFRRYYLGIYPKNGKFFISECVKYFPKLFFHKKNEDSIKTILSECPKKIIYHLSALNDKFRNSQQTGLNRSQVLEKFSTTEKLDATASLEGNAARKKQFTFAFFNDHKKELEDICCEPHLKLCYNDNYPGDASYSNNRRIYFHEGNKDFHNGNILIGHIGNHL